jgi:6-phosphogluconolactonase (cycloisomerase 2 family)
MSRFALSPTHTAFLPSLLLAVVPLLVGAGVAQAAPPSAGALKQLAAPNDCISEGGAICGTPSGRALNGPGALAVSPDGKNVYVASAISDAVAVFSRDASNGRLTQLAGSAGCIVNGPSTDVVGCDNTGRALNAAQGLSVSPDGKFVYVAASASKAIAVFARNGDTGALAQLAGGDGCIVHADAADIATCDNTARNLFFPASGVFSPGGAHFYVSLANGISAFSRNVDTGKLTEVPGASGCIVNGPDTDVPTCDNTGRGLENVFAVAPSPDGAHLYAGAFLSNSLAVLSRDAASGGLTQLAGAEGCVVDAPATDVATCNNSGKGLAGADYPLVSADGKHVYVAGFGDATGGGNVAAFSRNANGSVTQLPAPGDCVTDAAGGCGATGTGLAGASGLVLSPDDRLYVAGLDDDAIAAFSRQPSTGAIAQLAAPHDCFAEAPGECGSFGQGLDGALGLALSPDGRFLYSTATDGDAVAMFEREVAPVCTAAAASVQAGSSVSVPLPCTDANGDAVTRSIASNPSQGTLGTIDAAGAVSYFAPQSFVGADTFGFQASDGTNSSNIATASVDVTAAPPADPPPTDTPPTDTPPTDTPPTAGPSPGVAGACANVKRGTRRADRLVGTRLGDRLIGLAGDDVLEGRAGADCLEGRAGNDRLVGGNGKDKLTGGPGRDRLKGGGARDALSGGPGNDTINSRDGRRETVDCGKGRDAVTADAVDRLRGCERRKIR